MRLPVASYGTFQIVSEPLRFIERSGIELMFQASQQRTRTPLLIGAAFERQAPLYAGHVSRGLAQRIGRDALAAIAQQRLQAIHFDKAARADLDRIELAGCHQTPKGHSAKPRGAHRILHIDGDGFHSCLLSSRTIRVRQVEGVRSPQ